MEKRLSQAACAGGVAVVGRASARDWSTATVACSTFAAVALMSWFAAFSAVRVAERTFRAVLRMADVASRFTDLTFRRAERATWRTDRLALRTADFAFTRVVALRALTLIRAAVFFRATLRRTERLLRALGLRRAGFFAFFLAAMTFTPENSDANAGVARCHAPAST
jgi:hypothetical protein